MRIYPKAKDTGIQNMATDWWLFENARVASFRHYQWTLAETSFGYGQNWEWVERTTSISINHLIRRPTGGGIVRHDNDWTYCLVLPIKHESFQIPPLDLYKQVHQCIAKALAKKDLLTNLQPCTGQKGKIIPGDCFEEPVGWDLMNFDCSKKIAGAAMKRSRKGLLLQGTIVMEKDWGIDQWAFEKDFTQFLSQMLGEQNEEVNWPQNMYLERNNIFRHFCSLEWKKQRKRT